MYRTTRMDQYNTDINSSDGPKVTGNCQKHNAFRVQTHPGPIGVHDLNITQKIIARNFEIKEGN